MPRSEPTVRWRLSHLQRIQASTIWGLCKANSSRNTEEDDQDSQYCWNSLTLPHPLSVPRPELLETWNPWVVLRAGWRTLQEKPSGQGTRKKTVDAQERGKFPIFSFCCFFHPCLKSKQPCDKRSDTGNRNQKAPKFLGRKPPAGTGGASIQRGWGNPFCFLSLSVHPLSLGSERSPGK